MNFNKKVYGYKYNGTIPLLLLLLGYFFIDSDLSVSQYLSRLMIPISMTPAWNSSDQPPLLQGMDVNLV